MAFWEGSFQAMDPLTLSTIIQLQLEDSEQLTANVKGKQREGTVSDAQLALQMYTEDLMSTDAVLTDRRMAQSIAMAVIRDGQAIERTHQREDQIVRDRELARRLQADATSPMDIDPVTKAVVSEEQEAWKDPEILAKVEAIYMRQPACSGSTPPALVYDSDSEDTVAESSAWAARRQGQDQPKPGHCAICLEDKEFFEVRFEAKYAELSTKNRTYCHDTKCNVFISAEDVDPNSGIATCPSCRKTTCPTCKGPSHTGDCPEDTALRQLVNVAEHEQWQRCYTCNRFVELETGCNHITCRCGAQFCYVCGARWKTCRCLQADEGRLYDRAAQIVDRDPNPGRRLFEPPRTLHSQPVSRRVSVTSTAAAARGRAVIRRAANVVSPEPSVWESDFEDRSEWEVDWSGNEEESLDAVLPIVPAPALPTMGSPITNPDRDLAIAEELEHLRENHECQHGEWRL
ncbi:hypothetical protein LTR56_013654 [Elasticomyces elasticus]|nr:hypothetical protein LTR22_023712 [Elasticomyces elasticus]KAK3637481.1 hypothetical protein LTR56_013654 [Elasticomyces elasticus]KAK4917859.1 hypothetical protein LTR49_014263 [Elasticomyces elasticus]KAK5757018.1 hypothetical protein LTS12_012832 [Elasticomyces elasticus]